MTNRGLLLTMTEPPPGMEEEFNAWYDEEHLPERLSIPGFRSARRWVWEKTYLATYELDSLAVLSSPAYLSFYEKPTPWSKRCLGKCAVFKRWACEQAAGGPADPAAKALLLLLGDQADSRASRRFVASEGAPRHVGLIELSTTPPAIDGARLYRAY